MWPKQSRGAGVFDPYDTIPYFLTEEYNEFLSRYHMPDGGVVLNCGLTVPNVSYDTVSVRLTEFIQYVYGDTSCGGVFTGNIPKSHDCWRDLVMLMAVNCTDDACVGIFSFPDNVRALVTELARCGVAVFRSQTLLSSPGPNLNTDVVHRRRLNASALDRLGETTVWCSQFGDAQDEDDADEGDDGEEDEEMAESCSDGEDGGGGTHATKRKASRSVSPVSSPCSP